MHKQQARNTLIIIEENMRADKKEKLNNLMRDILDAYFTIELGKDTYEPFFLLCLDYWSTYFDLKDIAIIYDPDMPLSDAGTNPGENQIFVSSQIQQLAQSYENFPRIFEYLCHECSHLDDYYNHRSCTYDPITHKNKCVNPSQSGLNALTLRMKEYRKNKYPNKPKFDEEITNYARFLYLNLHKEKYAREFNKKANNLFKQSLITYYTQTAHKVLKQDKDNIQQKFDVAFTFLNHIEKNRKINDLHLKLLANSTKNPFQVLYSELLSILPKTFDQVIETYDNLKNTSYDTCTDDFNKMADEVRFCTEILNLQAIDQFYNQNIIDQLKPKIINSTRIFRSFYQPIILGIDKKTSEQDIYNWLTQNVSDNETPEQPLGNYFDPAYIDKIYNQILKQTQLHTDNKNLNK